MSTVLDRMKQIMADNNYPIGQFYVDFGIANSSFTDWRRSKDGYPPTSVLVRFSERFDVSLDYLLFGTESSSKDSVEISSMNAEEKLLLAKFQSLPAVKQIRLMGYIDGLLDSSAFN